MKSLQYFFVFLIAVLTLVSSPILAQGVTTGNINGLVKDTNGEPLIAANVIIVHEPSGTQYGATTSTDGRFFLPNLKVGGPYTVTVSYLGYVSQTKKGIRIEIGQKLNLEFTLSDKSVNIGEVVVSGKKHEIIGSGRTGAETFIDIKSVEELPSVKRSTRDLTRLDPRSDGNFSFGGKNWLFNNFSLDGSYFNNSFGLDDPAPGGQANAEPVPFDAIEQVQVSVAPFDVREGGFTGAGINIVTKSGTNKYKGSLYTYFRNDNLIGNKVDGKDVFANPDLSFNQTGFSFSGPIKKNKLFFFLNAEIERREDPGSNFTADRDGNVTFGESRVSASIMDSIRQRMKTVYNYETGPYENYINQTKNEKLLIKLDWNINENNNLTFRYNRLDARREQGPHPFVLSFNNTGRGPNQNSLPFRNSGYRINNRLNSLALELNSRGKNFANRFFASYSKFKDFRDPFSRNFPTIEIGVSGVNYTTLGSEPFSIHNKLDQEVLQITNNYSYFLGKHIFTVGVNFEKFKFFNSFNIFRNGVFFLPAGVFTGAAFSSLADFFARTNPANPNFLNFNSSFYLGSGPFKGEDISVGQVGFYAQDEFFVSSNFTLTYGVRVDIPKYYTNLVDNPFSRGLTLLDQNDNPEIVDQSKLPGATALFSPRVGFNWDVNNNGTTQLRGGTGIFTGRIPFVWIGNNISNPGQNPNLPSYLRSFDVNAMVPNFKWPQSWTTNVAVDHLFSNGILGTIEVIYGKAINSIFVRNADLGKPVRTLPDGRPYFGGAGNNELNADGAGVYVIDNSSEGYNFSITGQLRKDFESGLTAQLSYTFLQAKNLMKSTEIASVLWQNNPVKGDPNNPELSYSEFGDRNRIIGGLRYRKDWSKNYSTSFGLFLEIAEGNRFTTAGGNRYSFIYAGDVNGDGASGNDLIYIPRNQSEINFASYVDAGGNTVTAAQQWAAFNTFLTQDAYLNSHRGQIADRNGETNPWFSNIDLRILQDISFLVGQRKQTLQLSLDILNVANLINSSWGVRKVATATATSPLELVKFDSAGAPVFNYKANLKQTFVNDPGQFSRWQMQLGIKYLF